MGMGTALAVFAAVVFGVAQFLNASVSSRVPGIVVARWTLASAALVTGAITAVTRPDGEPGTATWAVLAGAGAALGSAMLYRSLEDGQISVAIPLSTTTAMIIPAAVGLLALGENADLLTGAGIAAAVGAIALVTRSHDAARSSTLPSPVRRRARTNDTAPVGPLRSTGLPLLAGAGFAVELVGVSRFPEGQMISLLWVSFLVATLLLLPVRTPSRSHAPRRDVVAVMLAGALTATAMVAFHRATHLTGLSVAGVVIGLYPAVPILLAMVLLGERPSRTRIAGLVCAALAVLAIGGR
ncbi:MAG: EamA family transporter [Nesterenkonia sp.]